LFTVNFNYREFSNITIKLSANNILPWYSKDIYLINFISIFKWKKKENLFNLIRYLFNEDCRQPMAMGGFLI
jgi:hypothetical protein